MNDNINMDIIQHNWRLAKIVDFLTKANYSQDKIDYC